MRLSDRMRPGVESAPWVVDEVRRLEIQMESLKAEVEMLRGVGCMEDGDGPCGACRKCAYRRGAEAMREAAAQCGEDRARYWSEASVAEGGVTTMEDRAEESRFVAEDIRALPLPKEET